MEMLDGSQRLICEWEPSGMEEDGCCCGAEGGQHRQDTPTQRFLHKQTRLQRMVLLLVVGLVLLISVAVAALVTVVLGGRCHQSADSQPTVQPVSPSSGITAKQQQRKDKKENPSAMLTAPVGPSNRSYLEWEATLGNAYLRGGFNYSEGGNLVVPTSGIYRVFLQITYTCNNCTGDLATLKNKVVVYADQYKKNRELLSSVNRVGVKPWTKSLYTAGLFSLRANSRLRVWSSHPELIVKGRESEVFFGAELLPQ